jgi:hypothetical protein
MIAYFIFQHSKGSDRISMGARFSAPVQTGPEAHRAFYTVGTGSFPRVKRPGLGVDPPPPPPPASAEVKERVELYLYSPSGPSWPILGWTLRFKESRYPHVQGHRVFLLLDCLILRSSLTVHQPTGRNITEDLNVVASATTSSCDVPFQVKRESKSTSRELRRDLNRVTIHYIGYPLTVA